MRFFRAEKGSERAQLKSEQLSYTERVADMGWYILSAFAHSNPHAFLVMKPVDRHPTDQLVIDVEKYIDDPDNH